MKPRRRTESCVFFQEQVLNKPQGSLEEFQAAKSFEESLHKVQRSRREPSPDRSDWTPDAGATCEALRHALRTLRMSRRRRRTRLLRRRPIVGSRRSSALGLG